MYFLSFLPFLHPREMSGENPDLLEGIFREDDESGSSDSEQPESTADLILRATSTLGPGAASFTNKWIRDGDRNFFFDSSSNRLICHTAEGTYMQYLGGGRYVSIEDPTRGSSLSGNAATKESEENKESPSETKCCWVTTIAKSTIELFHRSKESKRQRVERGEAQQPTLSFDDLLAEAGENVAGFTEFVEKWGLGTEESALRHFLKLDKLLVSYIVKRFNPQKALPKNALIKFTDSLSKYPQKWRVYALIESGLTDSGEADTTPVGDDGLKFVSSGTDSEDESAIGLEESEDLKFQIMKLGADFFILNESPTNIFVDGMRCTPIDGPTGPLLDGSIIATPQYLLVIEVASTDELVKRRSAQQENS